MHRNAHFDILGLFVCNDENVKHLSMQSQMKCIDVPFRRNQPNVTNSIIEHYTQYYQKQQLRLSSRLLLIPNATQSHLILCESADPTGKCHTMTGTSLDATVMPHGLLVLSLPVGAESWVGDDSWRSGG